MTGDWTGVTSGMFMETGVTDLVTGIGALYGDPYAMEWSSNALISMPSVGRPPKVPRSIEFQSGALFGSAMVTGVSLRPRCAMKEIVGVV